MRRRILTRWRCALFGCGTVLLLPAALFADAGDAAALGYRHTLVQFALATLGMLGVLAWTRRKRQGPQFERVRIAFLVIIALAAAASYFNFGRVQHAGGLKITDVYHYYMGSKYSAEVGYFGLYDCTLAALIEHDVFEKFELPQVRNQETLKFPTPDETLARSRQCRRGLTPARWIAFRKDVRWFTPRLGTDGWKRLLRDHGYNPTPVWSFIGGATAGLVPLGSTAFRLLIQVDRVLIGASILAMGWAFGVEAAALALIVWGTGSHWGYQWIGDSMLRNLWLASVLIGISLLKKGRSTLAGALLALASLLRIFPAIFVLGFLAHAFVIFRNQGKLPRDTLRFVASGAATLVLLLGAATWLGSGGLEAFPAFVQKISAFAARPNLNELGLSSFLWRIVLYLDGDLTVNELGKLILSASPSLQERLIIRGVQFAIVIPAMLIFLRTLPTLAAWEATALAGCFIPILSNPANYYYGFVLIVAMLGSRRFALRVLLIAGALAWIANSILFYRVPAEYIGASCIAFGLTLATLFIEWRSSARTG